MPKEPSIQGAKGAPLYFLHIPKTAGMSLNALLGHYFPESATAPFTLTQDMARALKADPHCLDRYQFIRGHLGYAPPLLMRAKPRVVTFLREPVARTLSHISHILRHADHWLRPLLPKANPAPEELLAFPPARRLFTNFQARHLAQDFDFTRPLVSDEGEPLEPNLGRLLAFISPKISEGMLLARAQERLSGCFFVGRTERFPESAQALCALLGKPPAKEIPYENEGGKTTALTISKELREEISCLTQLDSVLYRGVQSSE